MNEPPTIWELAQKKCWAHIETATAMMKVLDVLKELNVLQVIPILSDTSPTLMITPDGADDITSVKAITRYIKIALQADGPWLHLPINDEWVFRIKGPTGIVIDLLTRLPATVERPVEV